MLRSIGPDGLAQLRRAASLGDVALDMALLRVGVLAPRDLDEIRSVLTLPETTLTAGRNQDGHAVVRVVRDGAPMAAVHHDGSVTHALATA